MPDASELELGDLFEIDGEDWELVSVRNGRDAKLRRDGLEDDWVVMSFAELLRSVATRRSTSRADPRPSDGEWPTDVLDMELHLLEAFRGQPMSASATASRAPYDLTRTTQEGRLATKASELAGTSLARTRRTLYNYWTVYQSEGLAGLNSRMHRKGQKRLVVSKMDPRLVAVIDEVLDGGQDLSTTTRRRCAAQVRRVLDIRYPGDPIADIKPTTLQGYINERDAGRYTFDKASTRSTASNKPDRQYNTGEAAQLGEICEIDSTKLDVLVWDDQGNEFRPTLTVLFDVASRVPMSWAIHADPPTGFDHALLIARAIVGRKAIPGSSATRLAASSVLPTKLMKKVNRFLDDDSLAIPWIFPQAITIDGGADFRSGVFASACRRYGITQVLAPPGAATVKPHVERNFGTISTDFASWLAGSVGNSVANRGRRVKPTLTLDSVRAAFDTWVTTVYLNKPHGGLKVPMFPGREWTPNQMYAVLFEFSPGVQLPFGQEEYFSLLPTAKRVISGSGIEFKNRRYDSLLLADLRNRSLTTTGARPGSRAARKFDISYDPYNLNCVWVQHPETGQWIECWDVSLEESAAWMAAEAAVKLVERFGNGDLAEKPKQAEFLDEMERRAKRDGRARNKHLASLGRAAAPDEDAPSATESIDKSPQPPMPRFDPDDIDWDSPSLSVVTYKELG